MLRAKLTLATLPLGGRTWAFLKPQQVYWYLSSSAHPPLNLCTKSHNDDGCHYYYYLSSQQQHFVSSQGLNCIAKFSPHLYWSSSQPKAISETFRFLFCTDQRAVGCAGVTPLQGSCEGLFKTYSSWPETSSRACAVSQARNSISPKKLHLKSPWSQQRSHRDSHCTSAMHQIQVPRYEEEEKLIWPEIWPTHLLSPTRAQVTQPHRNCGVKLPLPGLGKQSKCNFQPLRLKREWPQNNVLLLDQNSY